MNDQGHVPGTPVAGSPGSSCHLPMVMLEDPPVWVSGLSDVSSPLVLGVGAVKQIDSKEPLHLFGAFRSPLCDALGLGYLRCHQEGIEGEASSHL